MARNGVDQLVQKYLNEPGFRIKLKRDPEGTAKAYGISLNSEDWATVKNVVMSTSNEALRTRISKGLYN